MRSWILLIILIGLIVLVSLGCSRGGSPTVPPVDEFTVTGEENDTTGHMLWGAWEFTVDPDSLDITIEPSRYIHHFNVISFVMPPSCLDCISMEVLDVDLSQSLFSVRIMLKNPTALTGYDIRGIVHLKGDQLLINADNWTSLFDVPGDYDRNPFQAFAKEDPNRAFEGGETHSATYRLVLPPGQMAVSFAVDASFPSNCPDPYEIDIFKGIDFLDNFGSYSESIEVYVYDWQNDVAAVQLDLSALGAATPLTLTQQGGSWKASVTNSYGAAPGYYIAWVQASCTTGPWIYQPIEIEVKSFGQDRLESTLSLMHNWSNGNPNETLTKDNLKYEGSDLNFIVPDMRQLNQSINSRLPYYDGIHREPLKTVPHCSNLLNNLEAETDPPNLYNILTIGTQQLGETFTPTSFGYSPTANPIADEMAGLYVAIGSSLSESDKNLIASQTAGLPIELQYMAAAILKAVAEGYQYRENALSGYSSDIINILYNYGTNWFYEAMQYWAVIDEGANFDYSNMYRAAGPVFQAMDGLRDLGLFYVPQDSASWSWDTPIGVVKIGGSGNETHGSDEYLILIDPGGDDQYDCQAGASASLDNPFSICIDLAGNDHYLDQGGMVYSQGAGRMGVGILWDVYGDDDYDNNRNGQGFGSWGVGLIYDSAGNDQYNADGTSQGAGAMGIGILIDEWGNDTYDCYHFSQGFAFVKGWGFAYDHEGNDRWTANDTNIIYPSLQTSEHNVSMSQGTAYGLRWDLEDTFQSGGQGILFDRSGDDEFSCGVFGLGCAYWFGTGIFADYGGNDTSYGIWYVNGGTAHYGTAFLVAKGDGNDSYTATMGVGVGGAHDFSNTFFLEEGGNDTYLSAPHSLGAGNECGTGILVDYAGDDVYLTTHTGSMGRGNWSDGRNRGAWGVFLDLGGTDIYQPEKQAQGCNNSTTWTIGDIGAGGDFTNGIVIWH